MALDAAEVLKGLTEIIHDDTDIPVDQIEAGKSFTDDLDIDSLSMMTIITNAENQFDVRIPEDEMKNLITVGDAVDFIVKAAA